MNCFRSEWVALAKNVFYNLQWALDKRWFWEKKNLGISKISNRKMADNLKIMLDLKNPCARCCPILIFWCVKWNYPRKNILKIQDNVFCLFGENWIFLFLPRRAKTEKSNFLRKDKKRYPEFLICFSLGNST